MKAIYQLFITILTGRATEEEELVFKEQMRRSENRILFERIKKIWEESSNLQGYHKVDPARAFRELSKKLERKEHAKRRILLSVTTGIAAGIILMLGLFNLFRLTTSDVDHPMVIQTEVGNRTLVLLPDSTRVWLNSLSSISYSDDFGKKERRVRLSGEGYFDVTHHKVPFVVDVNRFDIQVYGTKFNVSAYSDDKKIYTTLEEGAIGIILPNKKKLEIKPGQIATYSKTSHKFYLSMVNVKEYSVWKNNKMFMHAEPLANLARKLERKFNIEIEFDPIYISDSIHYSGVFDVENVEEILDAISLASNLKYEKKGNLYVIQRK